MRDQNEAYDSRFSFRILFFGTWLQSIKETVFRACVDISYSSFDYFVALGLIIYQYKSNTLNNEK